MLSLRTLTTRETVRGSMKLEEKKIIIIIYVIFKANDLERDCLCLILITLRTFSLRKRAQNL